MFHYFAWEEKQCSSSWVDPLLPFQSWKSKNVSKPGEMPLCLLLKVLISAVRQLLGPFGVSYLVLLIWEYFILVDSGLSPPLWKMISFPAHVCAVSWICSPMLLWRKSIYLISTDPLFELLFFPTFFIYCIINAPGDWNVIKFFIFCHYYQLTAISICNSYVAVSFPFIFKCKCFTFVVMFRSPSNQDVFVTRITVFPLSLRIVSLGASSSMPSSDFQLLLIFPTSNDVHCNGNESGTDRQN